MTITSVFIANRGEIAVRLARACADEGLASVAAFSGDDADAPHLRHADRVVALPGRGVAAWLDIEAIIDAAMKAGADAIHPGYGFLSENEAFARRCGERGLTFIGPEAETLALFGDKARARAFAASLDVPLAEGADVRSIEEAAAFLSSLGAGAAMLVKAVAGGGGRGMRLVRSPEELPEAFARCAAEAKAAFGRSDLYVERFVQGARHVEVQALGDGVAVVALGDRDCTLQRRYQKLIEIAPAPGLSPGLRAALERASLRMAKAAKLRSLCTFEFLTEPETERFIFLEANPRLQVEHTVTEEVLGLDLVGLQLAIAQGKTLSGLGLRAAPAARGTAVQARIGMERIGADGAALPSGGTVSAHEPPTGPGLRVDGFLTAGCRTVPGYDSLAAKVIAHAPQGGFPEAARRLDRALAQFRIGGVETNIAFLRALLRDARVLAGHVDTRFVEEHTAELVAASGELRPRSDHAEPAQTDAAGAPDAPVEPGLVAARAPAAGIVGLVEARIGEAVEEGQALVILEAMKMQLAVLSPVSGELVELRVAAGDPVESDRIVAVIAPDGGATRARGAASDDPDVLRPELAAFRERLAFTSDAARSTAVAARHAKGRPTIRESIAALLDLDSFVEYGALAVPAQRSRRDLDDLVRNAPADGLVAGVGAIGADESETPTRAIVLGYDYTVMAGTQGIMGHRKTDRMLHLAEEWRVPVVLFAEGGGGRPGDVDHLGVTGLDSPTFWRLARLKGIAPLFGVVSGRCFAGNAALLGCCDLIVATRASSIGMAGPAMIEAAGLGSVMPDAVGPAHMHDRRGLIDVLVETDEEAVAVTRRLISMLHRRGRDWTAPDAQRLRTILPANRLRAYDVHAVLDGLFDTGSVIEMKAGHAPALVTALAQLEGRTVGVLANNPVHRAGAVDADAAAKAAGFFRLCDRFAVPVVSLVDTPGFMVGPDEEARGMVEKSAEMFAASARLSSALLTIVLRKAYGLGAMAMAGGSLHRSAMTVAWPSAEFGGMGIEGAVRLAYRAEFAAAPEAERKALFDAKVAELYARGSAINIASYLEIDGLIDPAETRIWLRRMLESFVR